MNIENTIYKNLTDHLKVIEVIRETLIAPIEQISRQLTESLSQGGTLFWCGNGGSAADCQHMAAELVGRFKNNRRALRSVSLTTDTSVLTCVANDFSYDEVFSRQIEALGRPGDVLIGITTSGNSENVLRALRTSKEMGLITIALLGKEGGVALDLADIPLVIPSESSARVQEGHILIGHILCDLIEKELKLA